MRKIWVTFARKGIHCYPDAPKQVDYLASPHRHLFKFKVTVEVFHNDRDIEFHMLQTQIEGMYDSGVLQLDHQSCEMLAETLLLTLESEYPNRRMEVEVSEDGECGSVVDNSEFFK